MLGRLHVIPPLFSKVETEFGTAQDSARDLAEHFGVWLKRGVKKNLLCVFHTGGRVSMGTSGVTEESGLGSASGEHLDRGQKTATRSSTASLL